MTNPFELLTRYAAEYYNKASSSSSVSSQLTSPSSHKSIVYALGTTILATILYKSLYKQSAIPIQRSKHFLYTISLPLQYLYYKFVIRNDSASASASATTDTILFENKYFKEYDEWKEAAAAVSQDTITTTTAEEEHKKECLENMYYSTVREKINDFYGDVIMCYDHATLSFAYYARTGNIPYKYLETISRKYMVETNAPREIHVDIRDEYKKAKERTQTSNTSASANNQSNKNPSQGGGTSTNNPSQGGGTPGGTPTDVFVKLKSYNKASNLNLHTTTNDTKEKMHKFVGEHSDSNDNTTSTSTTDKIIRDRANRYSYRGKIDDFDEHHKTFLAERRKNATAQDEGNQSTTRPVVGDDHLPPPTTSYAEFKKQMKARSAL